MQTGFILLFVFFYNLSFSQTEPMPPPVPVKSESTEKKEVRLEIVEFCDVDAQFPGGNAALQKFISENIQYPPNSLANGEQGKVYLSFVVSADGSLNNIQVDRGISADLDREAKRLISVMPKWIPGEFNGKTVSTMCRLPIIFWLQ